MNEEKAYSRLKNGSVQSFLRNTSRRYHAKNSPDSAIFRMVSRAKYSRSREAGTRTHKKFSGQAR